MKDDRTVIDKLQRGQLICYGHVERMDEEQIHILMEGQSQSGQM